MAEYTLFPAKVVTPDGVAFDGEVRELELTSRAGGLGILARRAPIVADLKMGHVRAQLADGTWTTWATAEGFAQASESTATVVVEDAIRVDDIDAGTIAELISEGRAQRAHCEAEGDDLGVRAADRQVAWGEHLTTVLATQR